MGTKRKRNCEFSEEYANALFGEEIGSLVDDGGGDEGWNGELRVFSSVFYRAHDLLESATSNNGNVLPSDAIVSNGCVPFQSGNAAISVIEYSCLPEGLESQGAKVRQVRLCSDTSNPDVTGESLENNCEFLISESRKNLGTGLHHSGCIDASSENFFVILNSKPAEKTGDGCLHLVSPEVVDGANEHSDKKEAMQYITGSVVESSADEPQEIGNGSVLDTAFLDASSEKSFGILSSKALKEIGNGKVFSLDISSAKGVFAEEDRGVNFGHLNGKCRVSMGTGSKLKSATEHSYLPVEVESHGAESKKVNLQTDIAGSIVIGVAYENSSEMLSSKEHFVNNSFCVSGPTGIPSDNSSGTLVTKTENSEHNSMPFALPNAIEDAIGTVDAGDTIHNITDLVAESSISDILSHDCSFEKPTAWNDKRCKGERLDCKQSCQKALVAFDGSGLDTQTPNDGLAKEAINAMVVITSPVSQESSVSKTSETNVLATIEDDMQPLNIIGGNSEKRTREALLLMSDEVKTSWKKAFTAELRTRLWQNIKDFLVDAGFQVQYRHRPQRGAIDSVYVSPGRDRVRYASAVKAWKASADMLFHGKKKTMLDSPTREWEDTTDFWAQLTDALVLVEMEVGRMGHKTAILKRWALLDPFVTMLFIERLEPLKARENVLMRSTKEPRGRRISKRLVKQGKSKLTMSCGDPFEFSLEPGLQLESDTAHSQLTDVSQAEGSEDLGRSPVYAKTEGIAPVKGSSPSRKWACPPGQHCAVQEVEMLSLEESPPVFPDISSEINPTLHVVNVICMSKVHKDSECVSAFSNVDDSQIGIAPSTVLDKEIRDQVNILGKEPNQEGNPLGVEHKKVEYLGCCRSPCKKEEFHARGDDGVVCQAGILSSDGKHKSESKETKHARPYRYPSCGSLQNSQFEVPRKMNRSCKKSKNPVASDLSNLCNANVEGEASVAHEAKDQFMVISKGQETKSSKLLKKIHKSPADKKHKGTTKPDAASCLHHDLSKVKNTCLHETWAFKKEALIGDDGRKSPVRSPIDDRSSVHQASSKAVKIYKCKASNEIGRKKIKDETVSAKKVCQINDDDLLIAAIIKNKDLGSNSPSTVKARKKTARTARKLKSYRGGCKLLLRSPGKGGQHLLNGKQPAFYKRTVLSWMIDSGALFENEIVRYQSKNGALVKDGWITRDGLLCKCCNKIFSLSEFKIHAGSKVGRSLLNLFVETGDSFTLCQLQAWSAEYKARKAGKRMVDDAEVDLNDDTCGLCGDGGVLTCCDNCPSTFHHACLGNQLLPDDNWYCPYCTCEICGEAVLQQDALGSSVLIQCVQCECKYHKLCLADRLRCGGDDSTKETWFCGENCQEVHSGLRSHVGVMHHIGEGFSWTLLKCIQSDQRVHSAQGFALMAECNTKLAVALSIMEECFVPMIDSRTGIDMIPHALYNWGSCFTRLNYQGFYTMVLEKGDEIISVASIRVHGVVVAELPLVATCSEYRRQGMCRRLMNAIEEMLRSIKVEKLVILAIPELIDTWTSAFGFKQMDDSDKELLNNISLMVFPGTTLLEKRLHSPQSFEQKEIEQANKKVGERPEELDPSWVLEPGKQAAESYNDASDVGLEPIQTNLRLEEASLNGLVLESAGEMDPSGTIIECRHQDDQNGNMINGVVTESVHVNLQLLEASTSDLMLKAAKALTDVSVNVSHACAASISTSIIPHPDAQLGACTRMNEPLDNSKGNNAVDMDILVVSGERSSEIKLDCWRDLGSRVSDPDSEAVMET